LNVIRRFSKLSGSYYRIFPFFYKTMQPIYGIRTFTSPQSKVVLNRQALRLLTHTTFAASFILETDKGLMLHTDALRGNLGGNLLCVIS